MIAITIAGRLLRRLVRLSCRRPLATVAVSVLLGATGLAWTLHALAFRTSGRDLLPRGRAVWGLPLIIGTSAEFGLNVVMRYLEGREHGGPLVARSTVMGVAVSGLTTMLGFGSLMVAEHQGIFGLGLLLTIGAGCALVASLVVLPVVLRVLPRRARAGHAPVTAPGSSTA